MGVTTFVHEIPCSVSPSGMFKAMFVDGQTLMPKLMPRTIKSAEKLQGDGGVGTVIQINFADGPFKYEKHRTDEIDIENNFCKHTLFEGGLLADKLDAVVFEVKIEASSNGGCTVKITSHNHCQGDVGIKEEDITVGKEKAAEMCKAFDAYLTENPKPNA
ncbi:hypothetical protein GIB67_024360 [Kingdonia uniflora]|uniref:Bet v I/Major latex protein domain-containing protein n=1 Tax=Kingdonia uniflora TaxID=39325 RepID=A0A7J7LF32_9MAGN|nr:hypothetical protein GIB67_024360 [Kingdonia uniflora]